MIVNILGFIDVTRASYVIKVPSSIFNKELAVI